MLRRAVAVAALLVCLPAAWALQEKKAEAPPKQEAKKEATKESAKKTLPVRPPVKLTAAGEEFRDLQAEIRKAQAEMLLAYREAKTEADQEKALENYYKAGETFAPKFIEIAKKYPQDPIAGTALINVVSTMGDRPEVDTAIDMLLKDHEARLGQAAQSVSRGRGKGPGKLLRAILDKSKDEKTLAAANFGLGTMLSGESEKVYEKQPTEAETLSASAEKHFELVAERYAAADAALAGRAKGELFKIRNLSIGKVVPEIEGEDIDGKKFKLSDYRGKVVVIDFWGHW